MIQKYVDESLDLLRAMVRVPSESFKEEAVADLVFAKLGQWSLSPRRCGNNIISLSKCFSNKKPSLVLDAHLDTVAASPLYTRDPFDPGTDEKIIYGLGANDDGGSVVSMAAVFRCLYERDMPINLILCLNCEEEKSGPGGACMLYGPEGPQELKDAEWVIFGEPTGMKAAICERGLLVLDGKATGVSSHAARHDGVNALYIALDDISRLRGHKFSRISPTMGEVGLNVTMINSGSAHNVIPDICTFVVDIRPTELYSNEEIVGQLQALCRSTLTPRNLANRASATRSGSPLLKAARELGLETFASPTTSNWMRRNGDAIKMGPGESSRSHRADEFILVSEIREAVGKYIEFIEKLYGYTLE